MLSTLRPHQIRAMDLLRSSLRSGKRSPMLQAPTGFGKTVIAAAIVDGALSKGKRVTFCVPALSLIDQTVASFWREGIRDIGVIQADHPMTAPERPVQIASVQTLVKRQFPATDVVVIDEAHRWFDRYGEWMADPTAEQVKFVGLSATPWTKGLGRHFDDLLIASTTADLIRDGYLTPFRVFGPSAPDLSRVRTVAGDYHEGELATVMDEPQLVADVVTTWTQLGEFRPTLVFGVNRAHAKHLQDAFNAAGVAAGYIDAMTKADEREAVRKAFHDGSLRVVCNVGCLTTGVDWDVRCIVLARPTKSEALFVQIIGRGLRTAPGKQDLIILDHSNTHQTLGFVTDIHRTELDPGERKKAEKPEPKERLPKVCPSCSFLKPVSLRECPSCGFVPAKLSCVEVADGDLVSLDGKVIKASRAERQRWWSQLIGYCHKYRKPRSFALAMYKQKFGVWPRGLKDEVEQTGNEVFSYIQSRRIAFAKAKEKQAQMLAEVNEVANEHDQGIVPRQVA
jgi:DNA repair protein RadD